jgi:hypothetical protein
MKTKFENETIDETNVEYAIYKAIEKYGILDKIFWSTIIRLLKEKYHFKDSFHENLTEQIKRYDSKKVTRK